MLSNLEAVAKVRIGNVKKTFLTIGEESWGEKGKMKKKNCTEPHNHKMVEVGRDLWRLSGPSTLLKQSHLQLIVQDHVQTAFE